MFEQRKHSLVEKAIDLSTLCNCKIVLVLFTLQGKWIKYTPGNLDKILTKFMDAMPLEAYTND